MFGIVLVLALFLVFYAAYAKDERTEAKNNAAQLADAKFNTESW